MKTPRLAAALALSVAPQLLHARPIDCAHAASASEKTICADIPLIQLDALMDAEYNISLRFLAMGSAGAQRDDQLAFPAERDRCKTDKACLRAVYNKRIAIFERTIQHVQTFGPF